MLHESETFSRISWHCQKCGNPGIITSVSVNLTHLALEGACVHCRVGSTITFDLLELDRELTGWADADSCTEPDLKTQP